MKNKEDSDHTSTSSRASPPPPPPLYGDVLEAIISQVPTFDIIPTSKVSTAWCLAVASSFRRHPRLKPLLLIHLPRASLAYDPYSHTWAPFPPSHATLTCPLRSSLPSLLFSLSPSRLSLSSHPLAATWHHLPPPNVLRVDPVIAKVGSRVVVAGGTCDFDDFARAVEVFDLDDSSPCWTICYPIPEEFAQSSSATWLSVATSDKLLYVLEKDSALFSSFDPLTRKWSRTCELKPDNRTRVSAIGFSKGRLLLIGLSGTGFNLDPISLKIWEVGLDSDLIEFTEIGKMPVEMVEGLMGTGFGLSTIGFGLVEDFGYFYNPVDFGEGAVFWEIMEGKWERVEMPDEVDKDPTARIVFGCARVGLGDLKMVYESLCSNKK